MHEDLRAGARDAVPILLGIAPFALVAGIAAVDAGLTPAQAVGMSVFVYAGASQLAALELLGGNAPLAVVIATAVVINLRMVMYSASIAPHFAEYRRRTRAALAYFLTDQAYALSIAEYTRVDGDAGRSATETGAGAEESEETASTGRDRRYYYLGVATPIWVVWVVGTVIGIALGAGIPDAWGLSFAVPLVFLALLVPAMKDRPTTVAGGVGGAAAVVAAGLPFNLGLLVAAATGILAGLVAEGVRNR